MKPVSPTVALNAAIFNALAGKDLDRSIPTDKPVRIVDKEEEERGLKRVLGLKPEDDLPDLSDIEIGLIKSDPEYYRNAMIDAINDFTRVKMRENGFYRRIVPPLQINNDELDRAVDTDKPVKIASKGV